MISRDTVINKRPTEVEVYDSMAEIVDRIYEIGTNPKTSGNVAKYLDSSRGYQVEFVGRRFTGAEHWKEEVDSTWQEGVETIEGMVKELTALDLPKPISRRRRRVFDEYDGDDVDYDRLRSGQKFWGSARRISNPGPVTFTVIINASTNCQKSHREILWKGASGVAITQILEAAGYRVELWLTSYARKCYHDGCDEMTATKIKGSKDPLNVAALSTIVPGWFYRTGLFTLSATSIYGRRAVETLGYPNYDLTAAHVQEFTSDKNYSIIEPTNIRESQADLTKVINTINNIQHRK